MDSQSETSSCSNERQACPFNLNVKPLDSFPLDDIISRHLTPSQYLSSSIQNEDVLKDLQALKSDPKKSTDVFLLNVNNIELTSVDLDLSQRKEQEGQDQSSSVASIEPGEHVQPYLEFNSTVINPTATKLKEGAKHNKQMTKLAEDIEKQFTLAAYRVSKRQRKKQNQLKRKETLGDWFDMPRVAELTPEQEKDLAALRMRRVWDKKHFYKKSSQTMAGAKDVETSAFFNVGTVVESSADYYSARLPKKQRKATIVEELLSTSSSKIRRGGRK